MPGGQAGISVVGNLHLDILISAPDLPRKGETLLGRGWQQKCGGKGGNQAIEAARHGGKVSIVGAVGSDEFGRTLISNLQARGVGTGYVKSVRDANSGMSVAVLDESGDYGAIIVPGANWLLNEDDIERAQDILTTAAVLLIQNEAQEAINLRAARRARSAGARVILNAAPARAISPELLAITNILVVNAIEAEMMGGDKVETLADASRAAVRLLQSVPAVIVTVGGLGLAVATQGAAPVTLQALHVTLVSTHGAGDAFIGALAVRIAEGFGLEEAAKYANAAAAALVSTPEHLRAELTTRDTLRLLNG
jgi:ribokinase